MPFADVNRYITVIRSFSEVVAITGQLKVVVDDPDDDKVIECAVVGKADYIVTGDRHLLTLGQYSNISIVKAAQFISILSAP
jgi:putative PIN family toxin of toxin-antitoxin system